MNVRHFISLVPILFAAACAGDPEPAAPSQTRLVEGAPCTIEIGPDTPVQPCFDSSNRCANGRYRPSALACVASRWRCMPNEAFGSCPEDLGDASACTEGEVNGSCTGLCPDRSTASGSRVCENGRLICRVPEANCRVQTDAGNTTDTVDASVMPVETALTINPSSSVERGPLYGGRNDVRLRADQLQAGVIGVDPREMRYVIDATGSGNLTDNDGNTFFEDLRIIDDRGNVIGERPIIEALPEANARRIVVRFTALRASLRSGQILNPALIANLPYRASNAFIGTSFRVSVNDGDGRFFSLTAVRRLGETMSVAPEAIMNNFAAPGEERTLTRATLVADLGTGISSRTTVRRALDVMSSEILFSAGNRSQRVNQVIGIGVANAGAGYVRNEFHNVVTTCAAFDAEGRRLSAYVPPDPTNGFMIFSGMNVIVPANTTVAIRIGCNTASNVDRVNRYAIAVAQWYDIRLADVPSTEDTGVIVQPFLRNQLYEPTVVVTVANNGSLGITPEAAMWRSYDAGGTDWRTTHIYSFAVSLEHVLLGQFGIFVGNPACVRTVGIFARGSASPLGSAVVDGRNIVSVALDAPLTVDSREEITIAAQLNPVVADDQVGCHRGDRFAVSLTYGVTDAPWGSDYRAPIYNAMAFGVSSGVNVFAPIADRAAPVSLVTIN